MKTKGILILAMGHPNYGRMAFNLAASLKVVDPDINIALGFAGNALDHLWHYPITDYFFHLIPLTPEMYKRNDNIEWIKAKTWMYDISPFDETIFLDADMIWHPVKKISELFDELKDYPITFQNRGFLDLSKKDLDPKYSLWADVNEIKKAYAITKGKYYQLHSEFVYFKKCREVKKFFTTAKQIYDNLKVESFVFGGAIPDELPFGISMILNGIYPHEDNFVPIYWEVTEKKALHSEPKILYNEFFAYSTGGSFHTKSMKGFYNNLATFYFNKAGLQYPYLLQNKRDFVPERSNL